MEYKTLRAEYKGETRVLFDGNNFDNFNWLHELLGNRYTEVNDDLMNGIQDQYYGEWNEEHTEYSWGLFVNGTKEEDYINFIFTV